MSVTDGHFSNDWYMLLEDRWEWSATASFMASGGFDGVLSDGMPLVHFGGAPVPPRTERRFSTVANPLESGLWSGGEWCLVHEYPELPESLLQSGFSLLQNTEQRSRYSVYLRRRLPGAVLGSLSTSRGDSSGVSMVRLSRGPFEAHGVSWGDGYSMGAGFSPGPARIMGGFSRLFPGDRRPSIVGEIRAYPGKVFLGAGLGTAWSDPDVMWRGALLTGVSLEPVILSLHGDITDSSHVASMGVSLPGLVSAGVSVPDSGEVRGFMTGVIGALHLSGRFNDVNRAAASLGVQNGFLRGMGAVCWDFDRDSLSLSAWALPGVDWYRARIEAGARVCAGMNDEGSWEGVFDGLLGFTLRVFSFTLAIEDFTSPESRSWTFGVTWSFSDDPPEHGGEEEER
ncbi:MAG: hypothetical protein R6V62_09875 [Candidatus Fermentibacteraceae bacterium]